jgi:hypothetical protein
MSQDLVSFVLRFVREACEDQQARWRCVIKHVQSNTEAGFGQFSEALLVMQEHVNEVIKSGFEESEHFAKRADRLNPMEESARLWGNFMTPYAKMMANSMGEAMAASSSSPLSDRMEEAVSTTMAFWGLPTKPEQTRTEEAIDALADQVSFLADKIEELEAQLRLEKAEAATEEE